MSHLWHIILALAVCVQAVSKSLWVDTTDQVCARDDEVSFLQQWSVIETGRSRADRDRQELEISRAAIEFEATYPWDKKDKEPKERTFQIKGIRPDDDGMFPVFVYLPGTLEEFGSPRDLELVEYMAHKGFVAATLEYQNEDFCYNVCTPDGEECPRSFYGSNVTLFEKAKQIKTALDSICTAYHADCQQGVAVMGHSQGGLLALLLARLDHRISAVMPMGVGPLAARMSVRKAAMDVWRQDNKCILDDSISKHLPRSKRRFINGERDYHSDRDMEVDNIALQEYSGYACNARYTPVNCIQKDGSGYYIVSGSERTDGDGQNLIESSGTVELNVASLPRYRHGGASWCMQPSLDWLARTAKHDWLEKVAKHSL